VRHDCASVDNGKLATGRKGKKSTIEIRKKYDYVKAKIDCYNMWKGERRNADRFFGLFHDKFGNTLMKLVMPRSQKPCFEFGNIPHRNRP